MLDFERLDDELYIAEYGLPKKGDAKEIWEKTKNNKEILNWAVKSKKDKFGEKDIVNGLAICDTMLIDYSSVDKDIYQKLVNLICSNENIARIVVDGARNGGYSFLLMTLWNHNLELTEEQKQFAVKEAMNKIGTTLWEKKNKEFAQKLDDMGITDEQTTIVDLDGCKNPVGRKTGSEFMNFMFASLSDTQAHGVDAFDIRYHVLRNPNWTVKEKQELIYEFYSDDEEYDEFLEQWEWGIINNIEVEYESLLELDKDSLFDCDYNILLNIYGNKEIADRIYDEIQFCKQMHALRPQQWELQFLTNERVLKKL